MNFSVNEAFPNYSGSIGGNGNITVRGGPIDPVEILVEPAGNKSDDTRLIFKLSIEVVPNTNPALPAISNVTIPFGGTLYKTPTMDSIEDSRSGTIVPKVDLTVANTYKILALVDPNGNGDLHTYSTTDDNYSDLPTAFAGFEYAVNGRGGSLDYEANPNGSFNKGFGFYKLVSAININSEGAWTAFTYTPNNLAVVGVCDNAVIKQTIISI